MDLVDLLPTIPFLTKLKPSELDALSKALIVDTYKDGHVFIHEGQRAEGIHLVVEGDVHVGRDRKGVWHPLTSVGPGDFFGLVSMLDSRDPTATCRAEGTVVVASMIRSVFAVTFGAHAPISIAFQHALCAQLARDFRAVDERIKAAFAQF